MILEDSNCVKSVFLYQHNIFGFADTFPGEGLEIPKIPLGALPMIQSGLPREPGQNTCNDCFNR